MLPETCKGSIVFFNQENGFGFIASDIGKIFLLKQHLQDASQAASLREGVLVQFIVVAGKHKVTGADQLMARNVLIVDHSANNASAVAENTNIHTSETVVTDSDQPLRKHGLGLARELIRRSGDVFNKKLVKALAYGLGKIDSDEQYARAKQLLASNQKPDGLQWKKLNAVLFDQANTAYKLHLWLDGFASTCDFLLIENAYLKGDGAQRLAIMNRCTAEQQQSLSGLMSVGQSQPDITQAAIEAHFTGIREIILAELSRAKQRIRVAVAWFTSHHLFDALCQRVRDGLQVELIILNDPINNWTEGLNFQEFIELGKANGNSRLYFSNVGDRLLHHKFCLIDGAVLLNGSYNWTYYAEGRNTENCMVFREHATLIEQFGEEFTRLTQVLQRVEEVVPFDAAFSPALDLHRVGAYRSDDMLAHAKEVRRSDTNLAAKLIKQALQLNPENEEAKRLLPKPPIKQNEQVIRDAGIQASLNEIEVAQQQLQMKKAAEEALVRQQEFEAVVRLEAQKREQQEQARQQEIERQKREDEQTRLQAERVALETRSQLEEQERKRLRDIADKEHKLKVQQEQIAEAKRKTEEQAEREREAQERAQRENQQRAAAAAAARAKQERELAEKAAVLEESKGVVMQGSRGELRINLEWKTFDDLDLHVYDPDGNHIHYNSKEATCQASVGKLDVDANAGGPQTQTPQENIFWASNPPEGTYKVEVQNYSIRELVDCPFVLTLIPTVGKSMVLAGKTIGLQTPVNVIEFKYLKATGIKVVNSI